MLTSLALIFLAGLAMAAPVSYTHLDVYKRQAWGDDSWMTERKSFGHGRPINIYQVHAGSWRRHEDGRLCTYAELADTLPDYVHEMGYNYLELTPLMEYSFDGAWGYRTTNYFSPTFRYGDPDGLRKLVDRCHQPVSYTHLGCETFLRKGMI